MAASIVRIYLPKQCLKEASGYLIGFIDHSLMSCCITGLLPSSNNCSSLPLPQLHNHTCGIIGVWQNEFSSSKVDCDTDSSNSRSEIFLRISSVAGKQLLVETGINADVTVILFDARQFVHSVLLESNIDSSATNVGTIAKGFSRHKLYVEDNLKQQPPETQISMIDFTRCRQSLLSFILEFILQDLIYLALFFIGIFSHIFSFMSWSYMATVRNGLLMPAVIAQVLHKYDHLNLRVKSARLSRRHQLCFTSCIWLYSLDVIVGSVLTVLLLNNFDTTDAAERFLAYAEAVATELEKLLHWMMGAPAGLKLNQPLAHFLGNFFVYHIFLWKAYLRALRPFAGFAVTCSCLTGCLGLTVQLSIIQDLLSMMTLHIYCFYVYAARLYCLQLRALSSLWRLFRGKKWNSLRKRVDSATYDIDQLFLGTLLLTVFLFLLPTTGLFYIVFSVLRVVVLLMHGIIVKIVSVINNLPVYWLLLRLFHSDIISGNVKISIHQTSPLCLLLEFTPVNVNDLYTINGTLEPPPDSAAPTTENSWKELFGKLLTGELIYPWIEQTPRRT